MLAYIFYLFNHLKVALLIILFIRASDDGILESRMKCKARQIGDQNAKVRMVNFVIMVVNAISVLESMERGHAETKRYTKIIAEAFNNPFLSFKGIMGSLIYSVSNVTQ